MSAGRSHPLAMAQSRSRAFSREHAPQTVKWLPSHCPYFCSHKLFCTCYKRSTSCSVFLSLDKIQFAYKKCRGTKDACIASNHTIRMHLDQPKCYASALFVEFSQFSIHLTWDIGFLPKTFQVILLQVLALLWVTDSNTSTLVTVTFLLPEAAPAAHKAMYRWV